jgi:hypothetical protein
MWPASAVREPDIDSRAMDATRRETLEQTTRYVPADVE